MTDMQIIEYLKKKFIWFLTRSFSLFMMFLTFGIFQEVSKYHNGYAVFLSIVCFFSFILFLANSLYLLVEDLT